nr:hypothetical protein [Tanacetum cinerariifolium]
MCLHSLLPFSGANFRRDSGHAPVTTTAAQPPSTSPPLRHALPPTAGTITTTVAISSAANSNHHLHLVTATFAINILTSPTSSPSSEHNFTTFVISHLVTTIRTPRQPPPFHNIFSSLDGFIF